MTTVRSRTLSTVLPQATECDPQALLPIMPPSVHRLCVDGSGPKVRPWAAAAARRSSSTTPGWTRAVLAPGSMLSTERRCREKSMTTASLTAWPPMLVAAPRGSTGTSCRRQIPIVASTSSVLTGCTTPTGTCR